MSDRYLYLSNIIITNTNGYVKTENHRAYIAQHLFVVLFLDFLPQSYFTFLFIFKLIYISSFAGQLRNCLKVGIILFRCVTYLFLKVGS